MRRAITLIGGPLNLERRWHDRGKTIEVFEKPVGDLSTDPKPATYEIEPRRGVYERDPANPYKFIWKGWDA